MSGTHTKNCKQAVLPLHRNLTDLSRAVESLPPLPDAAPEVGTKQTDDQEEPPRAAAD